MESIKQLFINLFIEAWTTLAAYFALDISVNLNCH